FRMSDPFLKVCPRCREEKLSTEFSGAKASHDGIQGYCKTCMAEYVRCWNWRITPEQWAQALADQGGACACCRRPLLARADMNMDHTHNCPNGCVKPPTCGKCNRGILCRECNLGLGHFHDDVGRLIAAIEYLHRWHSRED